MKDQLSALIDGELEIESADHLIASAKAGGELKNCWAYYHLIGDAMRNEVSMSQGFSNRVMSALDAEPIIFAPNASNILSSIQSDALQANNSAPSGASSSARYAKSYQNIKNNKVWSVAASVAAVMFVGVMVLQLNQTEELAPVEIAQSVPTEYLQAHQAAAPNGAAYYIQNASFSAGSVDPK
jgi:sigma-E factor negative regulatory protein RseA